MLLASGGILYLIFQDIAPQVILRKHRGPPLAAILSFALAMLGSFSNV
jgi:ZIP family zinc transporter